MSQLPQTDWQRLQDVALCCCRSGTRGCWDLSMLSQAGFWRGSRFSTGHELGHWHHHRGQSFVCRSDDIGRPTDEKSRNAERLADAYSADLILSPFMIGPMLERRGEISLEGI